MIGQRQVESRRLIRLTVEELKRRETPARLLAVSPEVKVLLEDVDALYAMPSEQLAKLDLGIAKDFCYVVERGGVDGSLWDGPLDNEGNAQSGNALVYLFRGDHVPPDGWDGESPLPQGWYIGAIIEGCGANQQAYSQFAASVGCQMFQLTLTPQDDGKFAVDQSTLDMLAAAQLGDVFEVSVLTMGLEADLGTYATEGQVVDPDTGELVGNGILTLKLSAPVEGGYQLFTLESSLDLYGLHRDWTLVGSAFSQNEPSDYLRLVVR